MTGRARVNGLTCLQQVWLAIHRAPRPVCIHDVFAETSSLGFTRHMIDHHLRRLNELRAVRRITQDRKSKRYYYKTLGTMPVDGRWEPPVLQAEQDPEEVDTWGRGGSARKGAVTDLPPIPSLGDLLAR